VTRPIDYSQLPDNTPIIIGGGQYVERIESAVQPPFASPAELATHAALAAFAATQCTGCVDQIDTIAIVRLFSDSVAKWKSPFGASNNLPESVARRLGARPAHRVYSNAGGTEPLLLLFEMAQAIARGEKSLVLLAGAEAIAYQKYGRRNDLHCSWQEELDADLEDRLYLKRFACPEELRSGMTMPAHYYALIENYQAHQLGHDATQHRQYMAELLAPFSEVAARNPYAQYPRAYTSQELAGVEGSNYPISIPYTKRLVAQDSVNQSAALLLTSVGSAKALKIAPRNWVFLQGFAQGTDTFLLQRPNPGRSEAMARVNQKCLAMAETDINEIDLLDIYSCFPCAVTAACDTLGISPDGKLPLTVTGGLPFFGGPGSNYSMHALAEMAITLRDTARRGLITANGGQLSKHASLILSDLPCTPAGHPLQWPVEDTLEVREEDNESRPLCPAPRSGTVISYTVIYNKDQRNLGIVLCETHAGERFLARSTEADTTTFMENINPIGRVVSITTLQERHSFVFQ
jgi:acetyl-CoA C-acetyltransferase